MNISAVVTYKLFGQLNSKRQSCPSP